jgi:Fic family protein
MANSFKLWLNLKVNFHRYYKQFCEYPIAANLIDQLFANHYLTVTRAEKALKTSNPTARKTIDILVKNGMIGEITGRDWGKIYLAKEIADAIQNPA